MHEAAVILLYRGNWMLPISSIMLADRVVGSWELLRHLLGRNVVAHEYLLNQLCLLLTIKFYPVMDSSLQRLVKPT